MFIKHILKRLSITSCFFGLSAVMGLGAQDLGDSSKTGFLPEGLKLSGYVEMYYSLAPNYKAEGRHPDFLYSFTRRNEFNLNFGLLHAEYEAERMRGALGFMLGTYAAENLAGEPAWARNIYEARVGYQLLANKALWLDVGIMPSHLGFESPQSVPCWNLTRSLVAEGSPYYFSALRLGYETDKGDWYGALWLTNGWQRIVRVEGNSLPSGGHQLVWKPSEAWEISSSSFVGTDDPDSLRRMIYFHNFFTRWTPNAQWGFLLGFDVGAQQKQLGVSEYNNWYAPVGIVRWQEAGERYAVALRAEYFHDAGNVIADGGLDGFKNLGLSVNFDWQWRKNMWWRTEFRNFYLNSPIFMQSNGAMSRNYGYVTTALSLSF